MIDIISSLDAFLFPNLDWVSIFHDYWVCVKLFLLLVGLFLYVGSILALIRVFYEKVRAIVSKWYKSGDSDE